MKKAQYPLFLPVKNTLDISEDVAKFNRIIRGEVKTQSQSTLYYSPHLQSTVSTVYCTTM